MILIPWDKIPNNMKCDEVYEYYKILEKKKLTLLFKRIIDIVGSIILIVLLLPLFIILSIWIKIDSRGPVFFIQERVTQYGKRFRIFKFRTMVDISDKNGSQITIKNDNRITKVGKVIRKTRLDEIPQLFNILVGDMTFVGTRPEVPRYVDKYNNEMLATLLLPAGVTSIASIYFKDEDQILFYAENIDNDYVALVMPQKMEYNIQYLRDLSILSDIKIMIETIIKV